MTAVLDGTTATLQGPGAARAHARRLLDGLGVRVLDAGAGDLRVVLPDRTPIEAWAAGGGAALTGREDGPPLGGPAVVAGAMDGAAGVFHALTARAGHAVTVDGSALLGERAAAWGHGRRGDTSAGGACRLLPAADGWVAVNLPRDDDWSLVPAWIGTDAVQGSWEAIAAAVVTGSARELAGAAQHLGLPVAAAVHPHEVATDDQGTARRLTWPPLPWLVRTTRPAPPAHRPPRVVDLSSLWAGPLASRLLADAGADVVKVESERRPDGARAGPAAFFDGLNHGKRSVALDLRAPEGVEALRRLLRAADVVVEGSRPRALDQLGCGPQDLLGRDRDQVWVSITGYGRTGPWRQHAALGDDAAVAGGATADDGQGLVFCADATADPVTGLHAAIAALACWQAGGTHHVDVAMREVVACVLADHPDGLVGAPAAEPAADGWRLDGHPVRAPRLPTAPGPAAPLGAHTGEVLQEVVA